MTEIHFAGLGTLINVAGIIIGGLIGLFGGKFLTARAQNTLQDACALTVIFLGADGALKNLDTTILIASLIGGGLIGEIIDISGKFEQWIIVNKVDKKLDRGEKFSFKIIRGKKIDGRMRTRWIVKTVNILKQGNL